MVLEKLYSEKELNNQQEKKVDLLETVTTVVHSDSQITEEACNPIRVGE
jgi:hypothetical protein